MLCLYIYVVYMNKLVFKPNHPSNNLISLLNEQILHFHCAEGKVMVEPEINILVRSRLF